MADKKVDTRKLLHDQRVNVMRDMKRCYTEIFGAESLASKAVRADLKKFCRETTSTFHPDARVHALLEGRREVALRIQDFLELNVDQLVLKYGGVDVYSK